jgi:hypothetical protein
MRYCGFEGISCGFPEFDTGLISGGFSAAGASPSLFSRAAGASFSASACGEFFRR